MNEFTLVESHPQSVDSFQDATKLGTVKKVFVFNQDPDKVLKLHKATAEQRAVCRLLMNPFLKDAVAAAKKKLDIKDEDEDWKKMMFEMGKHKIRKLKKDKFEAQAEATGSTDGEKGKKAKKSPQNKKDKDAPLDDKSKAIDKNNRKDKFDKKRKQFMKAKGGASSGEAKPANTTTTVAKPAAPIKPKKDNTPVGPPKKVHLFPVEARKDTKDFQKRPARDFGDSKPKKWNKDDRPQKSFAPRGPPPAAAGFQRPKDNSAKLHPSWEAKKAKKPTISNFQGKKTTFAD